MHFKLQATPRWHLAWETSKACYNKLRYPLGGRVWLTHQPPRASLCVKPSFYWSIFCKWDSRMIGMPTVCVTFSQLPGSATSFDVWSPTAGGMCPLHCLQ